LAKNVPRTATTTTQSKKNYSSKLKADYSVKFNLSLHLQIFNPHYIQKNDANSMKQDGSTKT